MISDEVVFKLPATEIILTAERLVIFVSYEADPYNGERTDVTETRLGRLLLAATGEIEATCPTLDGAALGPHGDYAKFCPECAKLTP